MTMNDRPPHVRPTTVHSVHPFKDPSLHLFTTSRRPTSDLIFSFLSQLSLIVIVEGAPEQERISTWWSCDMCGAPKHHVM